MTRDDVFYLVSRRTGQAPAQCRASIEAFLEVTKECVKTGERIDLRGFGSFSVRETPSRIVRNWKTQQSMRVPPVRKVRFKPSKKYFAID
jgi:nucleoid DNA-binding protein